MNYLLSRQGRKQRRHGVAEVSLVVASGVAEGESLSVLTLCVVSESSPLALASPFGRRGNATRMSIWQNDEPKGEEGFS
ncbi:hypothetical protein N0Y54_41000 [Nostoc punctiforme UO1]|uniref:hypothetical protein n=1 Tax=Nostoc punctiforme TaxID=272131 RepID=UPI0030A13229